VFIHPKNQSLHGGLKFEFVPKKFCIEMGLNFFLILQIGPFNVLGTYSNYVVKLTSQARNTFIPIIAKHFEPILGGSLNDLILKLCMIILLIICANKGVCIVLMDVNPSHNIHW